MTTVKPGMVRMQNKGIKVLGPLQNGMRFLPVLAVWVLWAGAAFALNTTTELSANYSVAQTLVNVSADLSFDVLVPGLQYERPITVQWALPDAALAEVQNESLTIHVFAYSDPDSWIVFRQGNQTYKALAFELKCELAGGACSNNSVLLRNLTAVIAVPEEANASHTERVRIQASLLQNFSSVTAGKGQLEQVADQIQDVVDALPVEVVVQSVKQAAASAGNALTPTSKPDAANAGPSVQRIPGGKVSATTEPRIQTPAETAEIKSRDGGAAGAARQFASTVSGLLAAHPQEAGVGILVAVLVAGLFAWRLKNPKGPRGIFEA